MTDSPENAEDIPARGTMEQRVAEIRARLTNATPGPWFVWDGHAYFGGGRDLCIGAGTDWLANMGARSCENEYMHERAMLWINEAQMFADGHAPCMPEGNIDIMSLAQTCNLTDPFTVEQEANANFIARAREDVPFLLACIAHLDKEIADLHAENFRLRHPDFASSPPLDRERSNGA